jgi:alpha-D-ribose 1-methylphosphonate 5-triphosphate synthase subunit PhnH
MSAAVSGARLRLDADASRRAFDTLMRTLAEPGRVLPLDDLRPDGAHPVVLLALVLADVDLRVGFDDAVPAAVVAAVREATGAVRGAPAESHLSVLEAPDASTVAALPRGSGLAPEHGARVALRVHDLREHDLREHDLREHDDGGAAELLLTLRGPGVPGVRTLAVDGLAVEVVDAIVEANAAFPAGIDCWLFSDTGRVAAIPRSSRLTFARL